MTKGPDALVQAIGGVDDSGDFNGIKGLPESPPDGEEVVWQGEPKWGALSTRLFRVRLVLVYFTLLAGLTAFISEAAGPEILATFVWQLSLAVLAALILLEATKLLLRKVRKRKLLPAFEVVSYLLIQHQDDP